MSTLPSNASWRTDPASGAPAASDAPDRHPDDRVEAFFHTLEACLHVPKTRASGIRDELEAHVRDRIRDLMLAGMDEPAATDRALAELGGASALARSFHHAIRTPRSWIMNAAVTAIACTALGVGVWSLSRNDEPETPLRASRLAQDQAPALADIPLIGNLFIAAESAGEIHNQQPEARLRLEIHDHPLADVLPMIAALSGHTLDADYSDLPADQMVTLVGEFTLDGIAGAINRQSQRSGGDAIAFRVAEGVLHAATAHEFDRRDAQIICYRLDDLLNGEHEPEEVCLLIISMVDRDLWVDNGGTIAEMYSLGSVLFIKAPPRMHEQIRWIFEQINPTDEHSRATATNEALIAHITNEFTRLDPEPIVTRTAIQHASAAEMTAAIREYVQAELMPWVIRPVVITDEATNSIILKSTEEQGEELRELIGLIDQPAAETRDPRARERCFRLRHVDPDAARQLLGVLFNVSPALRECAVTRSIEVDDNLLILTATADQLDLVERIIEIVDRPSR